RLEALRTEAALQGRAPMYDGRCTQLSQRQVDDKLRAGEAHTVRLRMARAAGDVSGFEDIVHGSMRFRGATGFDDAVLLKSDGLATYHLASVVDDHLMGITHVLRGEEWLASTPKHLALFKAFGWDSPRYAHLPLLMNADGSKLSKRNRDGPMQGYVDDGYLAAALVNYVALLGWHPGGQQEVFSLAELQAAFSLGGLSRSKSVVSRDRLDWLNRQHLRHALGDPARAPGIAAQALVELRQMPGLGALEDVTPETVGHALRLCGDRLTRTRDLHAVAPFLFADPDPDLSSAAAGISKMPCESHAAVLAAAQALLAAAAPGGAQPEAWMGFVQQVAQAAQTPAKHVMAVLRHALTGQASGPKLPDLLGFLPPEAVQRRLRNALAAAESLR
ncbi:Glutamate--tRNA ligase mitochondrial, partial [Coemansia sp. RSA 2322]